MNTRIYAAPAVKWLNRGHSSYPDSKTKTNHIASNRRVVRKVTISRMGSDTGTSSAWY